MQKKLRRYGTGRETVEGLVDIKNQDRALRGQLPYCTVRQ